MSEPTEPSSAQVRWEGAVLRLVAGVGAVVSLTALGIGFSRAASEAHADARLAVIQAAIDGRAGIDINDPETAAELASIAPERTFAAVPQENAATAVTADQIRADYETAVGDGEEEDARWLWGGAVAMSLIVVRTTSKDWARLRAAKRNRMMVQPPPMLDDSDGRKSALEPRSYSGATAVSTGEQTDTDVTARQNGTG